MEAGHTDLLVETAAALIMSGVLWTMQILNYPLLARVGREAFTSYETAHNRRFGLVVFPGVLASLAGAIGLLVTRPLQIPRWAPACELAAKRVNPARQRHPHHRIMRRGAWWLPWHLSHERRGCPNQEERS